VNDAEGRVVETFEVDGAGRRVGRSETFHAEGSPAGFSTWRHGVLDGPFEKRSRDGRQVYRAEHVRGRVSGDARATRDGKTILEQKWRDGVLVEMNRAAARPIGAEALAEELRAILGGEAAGVRPAEGAPEREAALKRLKAYRRLCDVPWKDLRLDDAAGEACDAAAEVCRRLGRNTHAPERPEGFDAARFELGRKGAMNSNLWGGGDLVRSIDAYMDDSDPSNRAHVGHRRWCLNPAMLKTGFGRRGAFTAMWATDKSGPTPREPRYVSFPPAGCVPTDFFPAHGVWSTSFYAVDVDAAAVKITVETLDDCYVAWDAPLEIEHLRVADDRLGGAPALIYRPVAAVVRPGARYRRRISLDGGKTTCIDHVVEFVDPVVRAR